MKNGRPSKPASLTPITSIYVEGVKSIANPVTLEISPLTVLAGANSSGKSTVMQSLLLLKQTLEATYDPGPLLLHGSMVRFTSIDQILSRCSRTPRTNFSIGVTIEPKRGFRSTFQRHEGGGIEVSNCTLFHDESTIEIPSNMDAERLRERLIQIFKEERFVNDFLAARSKLRAEIESERFLLTPRLIGQDGAGYRIAMDADYTLGAIQEVIHLQGLRSAAERTYPVAAAGGPRFIGSFDKYMASIIADWQKKNDERLDSLNDDLVALSLTSKVAARPIDDTQVEIQVSRLGRQRSLEAGDMVNVADVGVGVSQALPIVVALRAALPGQMVYIEQPEIHLHPKAQIALAKLFVNAANRGVRVVIETHSSLLILSIQTLVAKGEISPELLRLHWFQRNDDGVTEVTTAELDDAGTWGDWPADFDDVTLDAERQFLDAVAQQRAS